MRILRVLTRPNLGGPTRQAVALWHAHAESGHETLLVTGTCEAGEDMLRLDLPAGAHVTIPSLRRSVRPLLDRRAAGELRAVVRAFDPDVVHTHTSKAGAVGRRVARALEVPCVHTYHGLVLRDYFSAPASWIFARLEARLARITDRNLAVSTSCRDELAEFGIRAEVLEPAVATRPLPRADARRELGLDDDAFVLGFVGRLAPVKRVEHFVAAVAATPGAIGVVVGDGPDAWTPTANVRRIGASDRAPALVSAFDVLVMPSRREGFPLAVVEAASAGVPAVGYDVPGVRDAIAAAGGMLVPESAGPAGLAAAAIRIRGRAPSPAILATCAPRRIADCLVAHYESILRR